MRRYLAAIGLSLGIILSGGSAAVAAPAATIVCTSGVPSKRADGSYDLLVSYTNYPRYTGRPFSFRLTLKGGNEVTGYYYRTYTFTGVPRSYHTPVLDKRYPWWSKLESWQSGTKCGTRTR